jgi:RNA polymerase sigma factor (sigma-70 family)
MEHSNGLQQDDEGAEAGEPVDPGDCAPPAPSLDARSSGVRACGARAPLDEGPCTSCEDVIRRYKHYVWSRIHRPGITDNEVEDIFQSVFVKLDQRIREKGMPDPLAPALLTLVGNAIRSHVRSKQRHRLDEDADTDMLPSSKPNPEQLLGLAEDAATQKRIVEATFARMHADQAQLIQLANIRGLSMREIAEILGGSEGTVGVRLHRARARFRELAGPLYNLCDGSRGRR